MSGLKVTFVNRQGVTVTIVLVANDRVRSNGDLILGPTRFDRPAITIPASQIVRYEVR